MRKEAAGDRAKFTWPVASKMVSSKLLQIYKNDDNGHGPTDGRGEKAFEKRFRKTTGSVETGGMTNGWRAGNAEARISDGRTRYSATEKRNRFNKCNARAAVGTRR